ncbi:PHD finger protein ALFIN-LIKE 4 [Hibiscus syriacus]|uniref:PHD finger protein ALFIN-LIKE 4 n=1 Tax=Hibiscus syriacus TaxID=106335 RepID=A0A6A3BW34_HIBSY|nr:PHD finger protein ALFIN-LIKE 4 [Hibiscus syriacus]
MDNSVAILSLRQPLAHVQALPHANLWLQNGRAIGPTTAAVAERQCTTGTIFGYLKGRVCLAIQDDPHSVPAFIIELPMLTSLLQKEMSSHIVRIALEREIKTHKKKVLEEFVWAVFCNGRKMGYSIRRKQLSDDELQLCSCSEKKQWLVLVLAVHTIEEIFRDQNAGRSAIVRALTYDVDDFYSHCDPDNENLCLYGYPNEGWEVALPVEEVPSELPKPALGINSARRDES